MKRPTPPIQPVEDSLKMMLKYPDIIEAHEELSYGKAFMPMFAAECVADTSFLDRRISDIDGSTRWIAWTDGLRATKRETLIISLRGKKKSLTVQLPEQVKDPKVADILSDCENLPLEEFERAMIAGFYELYTAPNEDQTRLHVNLGKYVLSMAVYEVFLLNGTPMPDLLADYSKSVGRAKSTGDDSR